MALLNPPSPIHPKSRIMGTPIEWIHTLILAKLLSNLNGNHIQRKTQKLIDSVPIIDYKIPWFCSNMVSISISNTWKSFLPIFWAPSPQTSDLHSSYHANSCSLGNTLFNEINWSPCDLSRIRSKRVVTQIIRQIPAWLLGLNHSAIESHFLTAGLNNWISNSWLPKEMFLPLLNYCKWFLAPHISPQKETWNLVTSSQLPNQKPQSSQSIETTVLKWSIFWGNPWTVFASIDVNP